MASPAGPALANTAGTWSPLGPSPVLNLGLGGPTYSGRVTALAVAPNDSSHVWLGAADGGVWYSADRGTTWTPQTDSQDALSIGSLAVDPQNSLTIYAGTGEANFNVDAYPGIGVLKSTDGGSSWLRLGAPTFSGLSIGRIVVDPANSNVVLLAASINLASNDTSGGILPPGVPFANAGIWRSTNGGGTWTKLLPVPDQHTVPPTPVGADGTDLVFDPADRTHNTVYAAVCDLNHTGTGIWKSTDAGASFQQLSSSVLPQCTDVRRTSLALSADGGTFYAVEADRTGNFGNLAKGSIFISNHTGTPWTAVPVPTDMATDCDEPNGAPPLDCHVGSITHAPEHQWGYELAVAIDPVDSRQAYIGGVALWHTGDHGQTWSPAGLGSHVHADHHALAFWGSGANPGNVYDGNDGGVWYGNTADTFYNLNQGGLNITQFYAGSIGTVGGNNQLYGGAQDNGVDVYPGTPTGLAQWDLVDTGSGDAGDVLVDYTNNQTVYEAWLQGFVHKSTDGGQTFHSAMQGLCKVNPPDGGPNCLDPNAVSTIMPLAMSQTNPNTLYAGTDRVYKTTDGANTWSTTATQALDNGATMSAIAVFAGNDNDVYVGDTSGNIYYSHNGFATWKQSNPLPNSPSGIVTALAVAPVNPSVVYATFSGFAASCPQVGQIACNHVFKSTDAGQTWADVSISTINNQQLPNIPFESVIVSPLDQNVVIAGSDAGVFESPDAGTTWLTLGTGLPHMALDQLFISHDGTQLYAATHGRGMWTIPLLTGTVYAGAGDGYVYAIDIHTGTARWATQPPGVTSNAGGLGGQALALDSNAIFAGTQTQELVSLNATTGVVASQVPLQGSMGFASPIVVNGTVYIGTSAGIEYAIDESTKLILWQYATGSAIGTTADGIQGSTVVNGVVYFAANNGTVYALNAQTGALLWSHVTDAGYGVQGFPAVANGVLYVGSDDGSVYALNASTGASIWSTQLGNGAVQTSPAVANGLVYVGNGQGLFALNASTGAQVWSYATPGYVVSSPAVVNAAVYFGTTNSGAVNNNVFALNANTGGLIWQTAIPNAVECSPIVVDGMVLIGDDAGLANPQLYALSVTSGAVVWSYTTAHGGYIAGRPVFGV